MLVIGAGIVGVAAARDVARQGLEVVLVERGELENPAGSSKGQARIFCPAAFPDESYLHRIHAALGHWREIESDCGVELLVETGVLSVGRTAIDGAGALAAAGFEFELLEPDEVRHRFSLDLGGGRRVLHQPRAGVLRADRAHAALGALARAAGVIVRERERVITVADVGGAVEVTTDEAEWEVGAVVCAAGSWTPSLLATAGISVPVRVSSQTVAYSDRPPSGVPSPALIDYEGSEPYALADPSVGLKAALHVPGPEADPDAPPSAAEAEIEAVVEWLAGVYGERAEPVLRETCMYTSSADETFVIEVHGRIVVASACSGQGFQYAPETGRRVAEVTGAVLGGSG